MTIRARVWLQPHSSKDVGVDNKFGQTLPSLRLAELQLLTCDNCLACFVMHRNAPRNFTFNVDVPRTLEPG